MDANLDIQIEKALRTYRASGVEDQVNYQKFNLYSIVTHSTAIEGSTVTEIENQLLFDEGIAAKGRSLTEQMMNVDLKDAYLYAFGIASENPTYTSQLLQQMSALVMRRTGSECSTIAGHFDSSKGEFRLCNVSAGIGGRSYLAYNKVPRAVDDFCSWLNEEIANADRANIAACYRLSFEAHFRLVSIHPWVDGNGRTTRLVMNMIQRQLWLVPSIVRKDDKGEYIQSLVDSREKDDSTIAQDVMLRHHIANLNRRVSQYQENDTVNTQSDTVNVTANANNYIVTGLKKSLQKVYTVILNNPEITHSEIMKALEKARAFDPFGHAGLTPLGEIRMTLAGEIKMTPVEASAGEFFVALRLLVLARRGSISKTTEYDCKIKKHPSMLRSRNGNKRDGQHVSPFPQYRTQVCPAVHFKRQDYRTAA